MSLTPRRRPLLSLAPLGLAGLAALAAPAMAGQYAYVMPPGPAAPWQFSATGGPGFASASQPSWGVAAGAPSGIRVADEGRLTLSFPAETTILEASATYDRHVTGGLPPHTVVSQLTTEAGLGRPNTGPTGGYDQLLVAGGQPAGQRQVIARVVAADDLDGWTGAISTNPTSLQAILAESTPPVVGASSPAAGTTVDAPAVRVDWRLADATSGPVAVLAVVLGAAGPQGLWAGTVDPTRMTGQATGGQAEVSGSSVIALPATSGAYSVVVYGLDVAGNLSQSAPISISYQAPAPAAGVPRPLDPPTPPPTPAPPAPIAAVPLRSVVTISRLGAQRRPRGPHRPVLAAVYGARFGIAGQVRSGSSPRAGVPVELIGPDGRIVTQTRTRARGGFLLRARAWRGGPFLVRAGVGDSSQRLIRLALAPRLSVARRVRVRAGQPLRIVASVNPERLGRGRLVVAQWRPAGRRQWQALRTGRVGPGGRIRLVQPLRFASPRAYSFPLRLVLPADRSRPGGVSRVVRVRVEASR